MKLRILVSPPGRRFSSISFFLSSSPAVRPSVSSPSVTTMLGEVVEEGLVVVVVVLVMEVEVVVEVVEEHLCIECSRSVVLRFGMNLSPTPLDFRDMPP